ncbi:MAG: heme exporter protein CcmD [Rhodospirillaceae bacterium]|nr:heme exporter protein CcmD [Rhodospirillaceae bacterium]MDE0616163.1 heme exporter protein CcmD [Rhodospirillaceae bacterium]
MDKIAEFFAMGGYAAYVWPALILTAAVMVGLAWHASRSLRREEAAAAALEQRSASPEGVVEDGEPEEGEPEAGIAT